MNPSSLLLWKLVCCAGLVVCAPSAALAQSTGNEVRSGSMTHGSGLEVALKSDRELYKMSDAITLQVLLTNRTRAPVYLYSLLDWGESAGLSVWVKDAKSGKEVAPGAFIPDALAVPPASKDAFTKLWPDHIYGVLIVVKLSELNLLRAGEYELSVRYLSPIPQGRTFGLPAWSREKGPVFSNAVKIQVAE